MDTCCIDKTSSAELSEAINSMFEWYRKSAVCFALLEDVTCTHDTYSYEDFAASRWFTRGWCLQELLAPDNLHFLNGDWVRIGSKYTLQKHLTQVTGIDANSLFTHNLESIPVARKMSWAANRQTTRLEDMAYCLLGIFGVNIPLLYGEGQRAFIRFQEEVLKITNDQTIFAWHSKHTLAPLPVPSGVLANHPHLFSDSADFVPAPRATRLPQHHEPVTVTSQGIRMNLAVNETKTGMHFAVLEAHESATSDRYLGFPVTKIGENGALYARQDRAKMLSIARDAVDFSKTATVYLWKAGNFPVEEQSLNVVQCWIRSIETPLGHQLYNYCYKKKQGPAVHTLNGKSSGDARYLHHRRRVNIPRHHATHVGIIDLRSHQGESFAVKILLDMQKRTARAVVLPLDPTAGPRPEDAEAIALLDEYSKKTPQPLEVSCQPALSMLVREDLTKQLQPVGLVPFHERVLQTLHRMKMRFPQYITPQIQTTMDSVMEQLANGDLSTVGSKDLQGLLEVEEELERMSASQPELLSRERLMQALDTIEQKHWDLLQPTTRELLPRIRKQIEEGAQLGEVEMQRVLQMERVLETRALASTAQTVEQTEVVEAHADAVETGPIESALLGFGYEDFEKEGVLRIPKAEDALDRMVKVCLLRKDEESMEEGTASLEMPFGRVCARIEGLKEEYKSNLAYVVDIWTESFANKF